eukprot:449435_1
MPPLGIGNGHSSNVSNTQEILNAILIETRRLETTRHDLEENKKILHKYILTIFCLYCRYLWIQHKQKKMNLCTSMQEFKSVITEMVQKLTQITFQMGSVPKIKSILKQLKFLQLYFSIYTLQLNHKSHKSFLKQIINVYYVFDRLVHKLDDRITDKLNAVNTQLERLQQQYKLEYKSASEIYETEQKQTQNENESDTSSIHTINNKVKALRMDVDGDSDNEINNNSNNNNKNDVGISDADVRALQQLIDQSQSKNNIRNAALDQLAALLPNNVSSITATNTVNNNRNNNRNNNVLVIQPTVQTVPILVQRTGHLLQPSLII